MYSIKDKAKETTNTTIRTIKNMTNFIMAVALVIVAGYAIWAVKSESHITAFTYVLAASAALIAVKGGYEVLKSFNR